MWLILSLLACENGCHTAAKVVPALEMVNPSWGAEPVIATLNIQIQKLTKWMYIPSSSMQYHFEATTRGGKNHFRR